MSSLIFRLCATTTPHIIYAGAKTQETSWLILISGRQDDEPVSPSLKEGAMEDVITATERESGDNFIGISVEEPQKVGDGMHSYLAYKWVPANWIRS